MQVYEIKLFKCWNIERICVHLRYSNVQKQALMALDTSAISPLTPTK